MSSAEALVRVQRLLAARNIVLVLCGITSDGSIDRALRSVGLFELDRVEWFETMNDAMECALPKYSG
jgi:sulfate permease, SulP family